ncbi:P-loop containing nucleoside triphosphate hydrolase protein [Xylaria acuta]|nr:P-loop containing nucleoside triphosphate hydrolase protein [Xylaria acuta]
MEDLFDETRPWFSNSEGIGLDDEDEPNEEIETLRNQKLSTNTLGTDLIEGKGNGLILLLHSGAGMGKTLAAGSVAGNAGKPLYGVTCAGIECVVLLDEAGVFLERRSLEDLERNALVSVFLCVLEYYEGILILTSNQVGTFDEAFKSQIQLALHYPALGPYERLQIWHNFFEKLDSLQDAPIDVDDLRDHLAELKEEEMNGRRIRNAITTVRQYANWKGETLAYAKLKDVIDVTGRFDEYLDRLHRGLTWDQLAEDEGLRRR